MDHSRCAHGRPNSLAIAVLAVVAGCAQQPVDDAGFLPEDARQHAAAQQQVPTDPLAMGYQAARAGNWAVAQAGFALALRDDLRNPQLQFLNGLAYDRLSRKGDRAKLELARVGYQNAVKFDPGSYWAYLQLGYLELDAGNYRNSQEAFAHAVQDQPQRWEAVYGLGVASYYSGDAAVARLAAEKASAIAPDNPLTQRLLAFAMAAAGEPGALDAARRMTPANPSDKVSLRRVAEVLRGVQLAQIDVTPATGPLSGGAAPGGESGAASDSPQIVIDLTIILSSQVRTESRGINLLDGLNFQYGYTNNYAANRPSGGEWSSLRSITSNIGIPQLTYSLNLFNNSGQSYQVLARPSLTAYLGRESEFFAGRTINVGVSGINLGSLQPIDVGVGLKVTPESINGDKITFRVSASRSFLSREQVGTFDESLTTFKQLVQATAQVEFGQTLLLSALSERVQDASFSKTPGLGDIPGPSILFNDRTALNRTESLLILVTPLRPTALATPDRQPSATVQHLLNAWSTWVNPASSVETVLQRLESQRFFSQAEHGDLKWGAAVTPGLLQEALEENVQLAAR
jgi:tetratricopeptide (TPR) repeat protein